MNYIKHLTGFFEKIKHDNDINPSVISTYIAIFQIWNQNRFKSPINASRDEIMFASKINSTATYHKCIKILEEKGYIIYTPSFSSYTRTSIEILALDDLLKPKTKQIQNLNLSSLKNETNTEQPLDQPLNQPLERLYNIYNNKHNKTINKHSKQSNKKIFDHTRSQKNKQETLFENENEPKKVAQKKACTEPSRNWENKNEIPPLWDRVFEFFISKSSTRLEAEKFYNHYSSNGWKVGGKTKMKDWHASARNWILNTNNYKPKIKYHPEHAEGPKPNHLHTNQDKNYAEPL